MTRRMPSGRRLLIAGTATLAGLLAANPALASGGALPPLVQDIGASLFLAGGLAVLFARLRIPSIAAFLLAGVLLGPAGLNFVTNAASVEAIAQIGFVLLLFVIGLEIDVRSLLSGGKKILLAGLIQFPLTLLFGLLAVKLLAGLGLAGVLGTEPLGPLYVGAAIGGSSSLLVVNLYQEQFQLDTQPGRISLTLLILQDIWAIVVTLVQPSLSHPDVAAIAFSFLGIGIVVAIAGLLARTVMRRAFEWIAKSPELILLGAVSWCFALVAIGTNLDHLTMLVGGVELHLSTTAGMAALIAGATIASLPFNTEIGTKVGLVKDFFITLFFVGLGITMPAISGYQVPLLAVMVAALAILSRQLVFFPLLNLLGIDQRSAEVTAIRLAQISEFGLVIAFLGVQQGQISREIASVLILAFVFTAVLTAPLFKSAYEIYARLKDLLSRLGFREPEEGGEEGERPIDLLVLGLHRDASSFLTELGKVYPEVLTRTVVVDFNVALHPRVRELGVHVHYGDIANAETLIHAGADRARVIICTISDDLLRGISNLDLVKILRHMNRQAVIISNAVEMRAYQTMREAGADIVYMPRLEVAAVLVEALRHAQEGRQEEFSAQQHERFGLPDTRREIMN